MFGGSEIGNIPLKNVFAADFGSWKDPCVECFLFTAALISSPAKRLEVPSCLKLGFVECLK